MMMGIVAQQPEPHTWRGTEAVAGSGGLSGSSVFSPFGLMSARFAGAGAQVARLNYLNMRATFAGAGGLVTNHKLQLKASAVLAGAGASIFNALQPPQTYAGSASLAGAGGVLAYGGQIWNVAATDFLARASGLDATHIWAYGELITNLVSDGVWSKLDALWVFATQNETTALLNLCSTSFAMSKVLSPSFTVDQGFAGNSTNYLNGGALNSFTQYTQNTAHLMAWSLTSGGSINRTIGDAGTLNHIHARYSDGKAYFRVNNASGVSATVATTKGSAIASRTDANTITGYKNGSQVATSGAVAASAVPSNNLTVPEGSANGSTDRIAAASAGGALTGTDASNLHTRLVTYFQTIGIASPT